MLIENNVNRQLRINAIIKGLILGVIVLASSIFSYYFITGITKTMLLIVACPYFFAIIVPLILTLFFSVDMRKKLGGYWSFKQAVTSIFIMFLVCYAILTIGRDFIFAKLVEPNMTQKTEAVMLNVNAESLKMQGASQKEINSQITERRKEFDTQESTGLGTIVQSYIINTILLFVIAMVFASILKKEPRFAPDVDKDMGE
jgi:Protein of unknown function (DUF4199)